MAGHDEGGIPEGVPLPDVLLLWRIDTLDLQQTTLDARDAASTGRDLKLGAQFLTENDPCSFTVAGCKFLNDGLAIPNGELRAKLFVRFARPGDRQRVAALLGFYPACRFVVLKVATHVLSRRDTRSKSHT